MSDWGYEIEESREYEEAREFLVKSILQEKSLEEATLEWLEESGNGSELIYALAYLQLTEGKKRIHKQLKEAALALAEEDIQSGDVYGDPVIYEELRGRLLAATEWGKSDWKTKAALRAEKLSFLEEHPMFDKKLDEPSKGEVGEAYILYQFKEKDKPKFEGFIGTIWIPRKTRGTRARCAFLAPDERKRDESLIEKAPDWFRELYEKANAVWSER